MALSGAAGVALLIAHFQIPSHVPGDNSPPATITQFVLHHHAAILATAWLQGLGSRLLPRSFGYSAVAFGGASILLGLAALFSATAFSLAIILIIAESAWVLAAAAALVISPKPASGAAVASQAAIVSSEEDFHAVRRPAS